VLQICSLELIYQYISSINQSNIWQCCTFSDVIVIITLLTNLKVVMFQYCFSKKNGFAYARTLIFVIFLGVSLKFILNFMPPNFILIFWSLYLFSDSSAEPCGRSWWFFVKSASYLSTYSRSCMRSEYLCWCNLFERKNMDNIFLIISALSIIWSQNWSLQQILATAEFYSAIDLKFMRRSSDYSRHASGKMIALC